MITAKEIQTEVLSAQQALIREAQAILSNRSDIEDHVSGLNELGFTGASSVITHKMQEAKRIHDLQDQYSFEYPGLKFIPEEAMAKVCTKYGLARGHVSRYIGEVPAWALKQIKDNKRHIGEESAEWRSFNMYGYLFWSNPLTGETIEQRKSPPPVKQSNLYIAAPKKDMRVKLNETVDVNGNIVAVQDPIVYLKVNGGGIVLAAWGEEGQDPEVFNVTTN
jgi:hypothetical protein